MRLEKRHHLLGEISEHLALKRHGRQEQNAREPGPLEFPDLGDDLLGSSPEVRRLDRSRGDETPIEGFEQDGYIEHSNANSRTFADLLNEFDFQRRSNMLMLRNISEENSSRMGTASDKPVSVRALAYIAAGHVTHHINILKERYLAA